MNSDARTESPNSGPEAVDVREPTAVAGREPIPDAVVGSEPDPDAVVGREPDPDAVVGRASAIDGGVVTVGVE